MRDIILKYYKSRRGTYILTPEDKIELRQYWAEEDRMKKTNPSQRVALQRRGKRYRIRHPFKRLCKSANKKHSTKLTPIMLWSVARKQKLICPLTGKRLTLENISLDHIIPLSKGGENTVNNIRLTDKSANLAKHFLSDTEFIRLCQEVVSYNAV